MDLDDRITLVTPEGVTLEVELAGLGTRFIGAMADLLLQVILLVIVDLIGAAAGGSGTPLLVITVVGAFVIWFLYFVPFEVLGAGRSPGKRLAHTRVLRSSGAPVDLPASLIRNLMRVIDGPLLLYVPSAIAIAVTRRNQRPGDLTAGTVVIRDRVPPRRRRGRRAATREAGDAQPTGIGAGGQERWDASAVTAAEAAAVRRFLERRVTLDAAARRQLALRLASGLRPKVTGVPDGLTPEQFLERLSAVKRGA